jgi:hypothetical protein
MAHKPKQTFPGRPINACLEPAVFAEFFPKTGKATFWELSLAKISLHIPHMGTNVKPSKARMNGNFAPRTTPAAHCMMSQDTEKAASLGRLISRFRRRAYEIAGRRRR